MPKRGTFVFIPSEYDIAALVEYRRYMEAAALHLAFERARKPLVADLARATRSMNKHLAAHDQPAAARADAAFHEALFLHAANPYLQEGYALAAGRFCALRAHLARRTALEQTQANQEHEAIVARLLEGKADEAEAILNQHVLHMGIAYATALREGLFDAARQTATPRRGRAAAG